MPGRHWPLVWMVMVTLVGPVDAQEGVHKSLGQFGAWNIISNLNAVTLQEDFWMGAKSVNDPKAVLSVECNRRTRTYSLVISSVNLKYLPFIKRMTIYSRTSNGKPVSLYATSSGTGNIVVYQSATEGSFNRVLASIFVPEPTPRAIGFSVGSSQLFFPLDGFVDAITNLSVHCGFYPDPTLGTGR
jgi:hypothetical protein